MTDPQGRHWEVERHVFELPHWPGLATPHLGPADGAMLGGGGDGLLGAVVGALVLVVFFTVWPAFLYLGWLVVAAGRTAARLVSGYRLVTAETRGERHRWQIRGRARAKAVAEAAGMAIAAGSDMPEGGTFETTAKAVLDESDVARQRPHGNVRVLKR